MTAAEQREAVLILRNPTRRFVAAVYLLLAVAAVLPVVASDSVVKRLIFAATIVMWTVLAVRTTRSAVWLDGQGVVARADRFTRRVALRDIDRF